MESHSNDGQLSEHYSSDELMNGGGGHDASLLTRIMNWFEKYLLILVIGGLLSGIGVASVSQPVVDRVDFTINIFMDWYAYVAPIAIFVILTPSLARLFTNKQMGKFGAFVISWYAGRKVLASLWAIVFIMVVFRVPLLPQGSTSLGAGIQETAASLATMAMTSAYFWAMYLAISVALIAKRAPQLTQLLEKIMTFVEAAGAFLLPVLPIFMFGIGAYIYGLPDNIQEQVGLDTQGKAVLLDLNIWGWVISPRTSGGMILIYVIGAVLTAIACMAWQLVLLVITRRQESRFSITGYFKDYWIKVYPLLWATSSEALATPLNLYLTKKYAPWINREIRRFTIGIGSYLNINGTIINVFILGAIVLLMLGLDISGIELLLLVPVVFLISYGVPGIPGELVLFAGPIATVLNVPEATLPIFLAVYIGIQLGLPDSFRTGSNSTDDYIGAVLMNAIYEKKYATEGEVQETPDVSSAPSAG